MNIYVDSKRPTQSTRRQQLTCFCHAQRYFLCLSCLRNLIIKIHIRRFLRDSFSSVRCFQKKYWRFILGSKDLDIKSIREVF